MRWAAAVMMMFGLGGCTILGVTMGAVVGGNRNDLIDRENAALPKRPIVFVPIPTEEQRAACEHRREAATAAASAARTDKERDWFLARIPNCLDVYAVTGLPPQKPKPPPTPKPHVSVGMHAFVGLLVGLTLDVGFVTWFDYQCRHSPQPGECL